MYPSSRMGSVPASAYPVDNPSPGVASIHQEINPNVGKNSFLERWKALVTPAARDMYELVAKEAGIQINPDSKITPLVLTAQTQISWTTKTHPGIPVSLNVDIPQQVGLPIYAEDPVFVRRVTCTVDTVVFNANGLSGFAGPPLPPPFEPQVLTSFPQGDPTDYIFCQMRRDGAGQIYQDRPVSLKQFCGTGSEPYFWSPVPVMKRGGRILIDLSILPPGQTSPNMLPPFVNRIGFVQLCFHVERFDPFGT
jgi:hypothetical protein